MKAYTKNRLPLLKKFAIILTVLSLFLSFVACGFNAPDNFPDAVAEADKKIDELNEMKYNGYLYQAVDSYETYGKVFDDANFYIILMKPYDYDAYLSSGMLTRSMCLTCAKSAYKEIKNYFSKVDVSIGVWIADDNVDNLDPMYTFTESDLQD